MPAGFGTQQQQHKYAYDTCCLPSRQIDVSDSCVWCLVLLQYMYCVQIVFKRIASHYMCKTKSG